LHPVLEKRPGHQSGLREQLLERARCALGAIEAARQRIDDLNVYPVPDGDTGANMTLTTRSIVEALERSEADDRATLAAEISRAALMGARGNSGVILSQIVRGAAESFAESDDLARALRRASDTVYAAVDTPVEGTMLTAIRELAEEAEAGGDLAAIVARGDDCVTRTREMLPVLREAGVVDSGAAGLVELVRGFAGFSSASAALQQVSLKSVHLEASLYRYCTSYVVEGEGLDIEALKRDLEPLGDSLLVVGSETALRAHVHTDDPDHAVALGRARGTVEAIEIGDMRAQIAAREERLSHPVVVVAQGEGNRRLLESLGATVVERAEDAPDSGVIVLSDSVPAAISALVVYDAELSVEENVAAMREAAAAVACGVVEQATDAASFEQEARAVVEQLLAEPRDLLMLLTGAEAPPVDDLVGWIRATYPGLELEVHDGGQPRYALLLGAE
jgi:dihydroxyacetone kinase-like predicted kinase